MKLYCQDDSCTETYDSVWHVNDLTSIMLPVLAPDQRCVLVDCKLMQALASNCAVTMQQS